MAKKKKPDLDEIYERRGTNERAILLTEDEFTDIIGTLKTQARRFDHAGAPVLSRTYQALINSLQDRWEQLETR